MAGREGDEKKKQCVWERRYVVEQQDYDREQARGGAGGTERPCERHEHPGELDDVTVEMVGRKGYNNI